VLVLDLVLLVLVDEEGFETDDVTEADDEVYEMDVAPWGMATTDAANAERTSSLEVENNMFEDELRVI